MRLVQLPRVNLPTRRNLAGWIVGGAIALGALTSAPHQPVPVAASVQYDPPGCVSAYRGDPGEDPTVAYCDQYAVDQAAPFDPVADCLLAQGFHGRPDDHVEVIYSTARAIEACATVDV